MVPAAGRHSSSRPMTAHQTRLRLGIPSAPSHALHHPSVAAPIRAPFFSQLCRLAAASTGQHQQGQQHELQCSQASHMCLEGDFETADVWPAIYSQPAIPSPLAPLPRHDTGPVPTAETPDRSPALQQPDVLHPLLVESQLLEDLIARMQALSSLSSRVSHLQAHPRVQTFMQNNSNQPVISAILTMDLEEQYVLLCLLAMGQPHVLTIPSQGLSTSLPMALDALSRTLLRVEQFYDSVGGVLGYQCRSLGLIISGTTELREARAFRQQAMAQREGPSQQTAAAAASPEQVGYHVPRALDLAGEDGREVGQRTAAVGLLAMPRMAEIYPVGGAGDRLGLMCETTGESLPAAMLPYCARTMMEGLLRDLQGREYLYYQVTGQQVTTPVAIMSSDAKGNHQRMTQLMESLQWFGRGRNAFRIFRQPLVPVISVEDGHWLLESAMQPMAKPGGHGAIWKLMRDEGVFAWLRSQGRDAALVRQISNPMAGMDTTLLALAGCGASRPGSAFGFMSCDRTIGAAEGCNVLQERRVQRDGKWHYEYGYTNIEYTEFDRLGISDQAVDGTSRRSVFPANTNVLYVGLRAAEAVIDRAIATSSPEQLMPGLIFNLKKQVSYHNPLTGQDSKVLAGRMECTMQNIADYMTDSMSTALSPTEVQRRELSTFLVYNMRRKVTSSAKKKRQPDSLHISQTPDGSFYDLQRNAWHLLHQCLVQRVPELGSVEQYLEEGPGFIFLWNPALGPLWDVISQKLVGGSLEQGSELVLEVAEARLRNVNVQGSLLVHADNVVGHMEGGLLCFSERCGRVNMSNVWIRNQGVDWEAPTNLYWKHQVTRRESVSIVLHGQSEFEAHDVMLNGSHTFEVPDGHRMLLSQDQTGQVSIRLTPLLAGTPTWQWVHSLAPSGQFTLQYVQRAAMYNLAVVGDVTSVPQSSWQPLSGRRSMSQLEPLALSLLAPRDHGPSTRQELLAMLELEASANGGSGDYEPPVGVGEEDSSGGGVINGSEQPRQEWKTLQQLCAMDWVADFTI